MKKTTIFLFALLCVAAGAFAQTSFEVNKVNYQIITNTNTVEVVKSDPRYSGDITIPTSVQNEGTTYEVTTISGWAFWYCTGLTSIDIPNSVTTIGDYAFFECSGLTSVTIPNSITTIGEKAFSICSNLNSVTIGSSVTTIGNYAFSECTSLTSITIPDKVTTIGYEAFYGCTGLTSVTIPNSVTTIGNYTFSECTGLTSITIPDKVTTLGERVFSGCSGLTSVTSLNPEPPAVTRSLGLSSEQYSTCTLYVPAEGQEAYKNHSEWGRFNSILAVATSVATASTSAAKVYALAGTLYVEGAVQPYAVYNLTGAQLYVGTAPSISLPHGTYVVSIGKERRKVIVP